MPIEKAIKVKERLNDYDVETILLNIINRKRFKYSISDILTYIMKCLCIKNINKNRRIKNKNKQHFLFEKGEEKLLEELDVVTILKSIRQIKLLT